MKVALIPDSRMMSRRHPPEHAAGPRGGSADPDGAWVSGTDRGAGAGTARMRICALAPSVTLQRMLHFLFNMQHYMMFEVLEPRCLLY